MLPPDNFIQKEIKACNLMLSYRKDLNVLTSRWENCSASFNLRQGYIESLNMASEWNVRFWLIDLRGRGPGTELDELWVLHEFFNKVRETFSQTFYMAYLLKPSHFYSVISRVPVNEVEQLQTIIQVNMFLNEEEAMNWLLQRQL